MVEIKVKHQEVIEEPPRVLTAKNVIFWSEHYKRLEGVEHGKGIQTKAKLFLKNNSIQYDKDETKYPNREFDGHRFVCLPILGYNKHTYRIWEKKNGEWECSCQFHQTNKIDCSHITALWMWLKMRNYNKR